jgi:beta-1,4-N-acetylglucosaminyltransferase
MIFVTVGMHSAGFERLVRAADEMASFVEEPVIIQRGGTQYTPKFSEYFDFADEAQMLDWLARARVVVAHGGAGSILNTLQVGKPLVVVPRLKRFGEVIDDHQMELAEALVQQGRTVAVTDLSSTTLWQAIEQIMSPPEATPLARMSAPRKLQDVLRAWLVEQSKSPAPWGLFGRRR